MMYGWGSGYYGGWLGPLFMLVFMALVVVGIVLLVRYLVGQSWTGGSGGGSGRQPLDVLKERFARGEISKDQYLQMRRDLGE